MNRLGSLVILGIFFVASMAIVISCSDTNNTSVSNARPSKTITSSNVAASDKTPWEAPTKAKVKLQIDVHTLVDKSESEVDNTLGIPTKIPSAWGSSCPSCVQNIYQTEMGRFTILFVNNKAYWIIIYGIDDLPFGKESLANIGLPISEPSGGTPGFIEWDRIGDLRYIAFVWDDTKGKIDYISLLGALASGQPLFPVNPTGRLDTPDTFLALCYKNAQIN